MLSVLCVEDDLDFQILLRESLKRTLDLHVEVASSGFEAIDLIEKGQRFDVIISDYAMPNGNGAELFRYLVSQQHGHMFILFTSQMDDPHLRRQFEGDGFLGIIPKNDMQSLVDTLVSTVTAWPMGRQTAHRES